jgi:hypothetical protein
VTRLHSRVGQTYRFAVITGKAEALLLVTQRRDGGSTVRRVRRVGDGDAAERADRPASPVPAAQITFVDLIRLHPI